MVPKQANIGQNDIDVTTKLTMIKTQSFTEETLKEPTSDEPRRKINERLRIVPAIESFCFHEMCESLYFWRTNAILIYVFTLAVTINIAHLLTYQMIIQRINLFYEHLKTP